jgi:hypothetical protein
MEISNVQKTSADSAFVSQKDNKTSSPFASFFQDASSSGSAVSGKASSSDPGGDEALQEFMSYAKETPAQRMFDSWLQDQNITKQQYDAMTPAEKQKLMNEFEAQMKQKLHNEMGALLALAAA